MGGQGCSSPAGCACTPEAASAARPTLRVIGPLDPGYLDGLGEGRVAPHRAAAARPAAASRTLRVISPLDASYPSQAWAPPRRAVAALDRPLQGDGSAPTYTLRQLFGAMRAQGLHPHPAGAAHDEEVAAAMLGEEADPYAAAPTPEESVRAQPHVGVAGGTFPRTAPCTPEAIATCDASGSGCAFQQDTIGKVGTYAQMLADIRAMGGGRVRRASQVEAYWGCVYPVNEEAGDLHQYGQRVIPPSAMEAGICEDSPCSAPRLAAMTAMILTCKVNQVKFDLALFNPGGGNPLNYAPSDPPAGLIPLDSRTFSTVSYAGVLLGAPAWQRGFLVPSGYGWDPVYWDFDVDGTRTDRQALYQRYALNVSPTEGSATTGYAQECARRKALGVAAFAWSIGRHLAAIDAVWAAHGVGRIYDVVEVMDIGNELDQYWAMPGGAESERDVAQGVAEVGRYLALLAGPIHAQLPRMKFRAEIASWLTIPFGVDNHAARVEWIGRVIGEGITAEVDTWGRLVANRWLASLGIAIDAESRAWFDSEAAVGFVWPPTGRSVPAPGDLLHQVGLHWYHGFNRWSFGEDYPEGYADAVRTEADIRLLMSAAEALTEFTLAVTVGEIGFPAVDPGAPPDKDYTRWAPSYSGTNATLQAAMHVRLVSLFLAVGARVANPFDFNYGYPSSNAPWPTSAFDRWTLFNSNGVHNDIQYQSPADPDYSQAVDCWPRPTWFALRRLNWLLSAVGFPLRQGVRLEYNERGLTVIRFRFAAPLSVGPDGAPLEGTFAHAYLVWIDQYADDPAHHTDGSPLGWATATLRCEYPHGALPAADPQFLPLVPEVIPPAPGDATGPNGYAQPRSVVWSDAAGALVGTTQADQYLDIVHWVLYPPTLSVTLTRCDPASGVALSPLLLLTNATFAGVS